jgi:hypothetical protein
MSELRLFRPAPLCAALIFAFAPGAFARDLGSFDVNAQSRPKAAAAADAPRNVDAIGRATFTWVQQDLDATAKAGATDAVTAARAHVRQLLGPQAKAGGADVVETLQDALQETQFGGAQLVRFTPRVDGIEIFHEGLALLMDRNERLVAMRGPLPRESSAQAKSLPAFRLDAAAAIAVALGGHDFEPTVEAKLQSEAREDAGEYEVFRLVAGARSKTGAFSGEPQRAKKVWFRTREGLQPAWYVETQVADSPEASIDNHAFVVSALDGRVLFRMNQTAHAAYSYRIWSESEPDHVPLPGPYGRSITPDPDGAQSNNPGTFVPPTLRTLSSVPFSRSSTDPWLPDGATLTRGNNVDAYADRNAPDGFSANDVRPTVTAPNTFDYEFNFGLAPSANATQTNAATVQLFYLINWLHDSWYDHGFAEADGNAQANNYGRGGAGNDAMVAQAQDYDSTNNAAMGTPADGFPPRMRTGLVTSTEPDTDNTIDTRTVAHEWGHYISNRLVGNASGLFTSHARGIGEGWGDILAMIAVVDESDRQKPGNAQYEGAYGGSYSEHSYFGVRRYPYSTQTSKNPLVLSNIARGSSPTFGVPRQNTSADNAEVHNQGEIWAIAVWEGYAGLLRDSGRLTFREAQARMKNYLVGGLKLTPVAPTMIEARDGILATIIANGATEDFAIFTTGFAKRGLGAGAVIPDRYSESMQFTLDSFSSGTDIAFKSAQLGLPTGCDADAVLDPGETARLSITLENAGFAALTGATVRVTASSPAVSFPEGDTVAVGDIALFGRKTVSLPVTLGASPGTAQPIAFTITPNAPGIQSPPGLIGQVITFVSFDEAARSSATEDFVGGAAAWQMVRSPVGTGPGTWFVRNDFSVRYLHGEDTAARSVNWAQTPAMAVGSTPLSVTLVHRYKFEADTDEGEWYDGGVVQASIDGGATWTDVAVPNGRILSNCCSNPYAGRAAFTDKNTGYPAFSETTLNLGTAFANQPNVRLRFGVATDEAVTAYGWDIDQIRVTGVTDTPFTSATAQNSSCAVASYKTLQGPLSGTYYSPTRSGEGVLIDFGQVGTTPVVFFSWYTYEGGQQQWLVGSAPFSTGSTGVALDLIETRGANFGSQFRSQDVVNTPWGNASLSFPDCDTLTLTYQKLTGETGTLSMQRGLSRLEQGQCSVLHGGLSGTYYSTARSGEGVLVDFGKAGNDPVEFFTWYTYEGGQQRWLVGSKRFAPTDPTVSVDLISTSGAQFGNAFRSQDVVNQPWGKVTQRFINCDTLELTYEKTGGETGTLTLNRGLQRLGDGVCR